MGWSVGGWGIVIRVYIGYFRKCVWNGFVKLDFF